MNKSGFDALSYDDVDKKERGGGGGLERKLKGKKQISCGSGMLAHTILKLKTTETPFMAIFLYYGPPKNSVSNF